MKDNFRKTNIICTIGPASEYIVEDMIKAGMNAARINFSHGGKEEQAEKVERIKEVRDRLGLPLSLVLDTQGPEIRLGRFSEGLEKIALNPGDKLVLLNTDELAEGNRVSISYKNLWADVSIGSRILVDDGAVILEVEKIENEEIHCVAINSGIIKERKSVNVPGTIVKLPTLKEKDINDLLYGIEAGFDYIAASFVRNKKDVLEIRKLLDDNGGKDIKIIAKIENQEGIDNIEAIIEAADGVMIARGDLAVEVPFEEVPIYQKSIIQKCNQVGKPVIVATQMLESMTNNPMPTRAEASDVATAVFDRTSAVMLSGESAVGKYPLQCVGTMSKIAGNVESKSRYWKKMETLTIPHATLEDRVSYITVQTAKIISADAIVAYTHTGDSVRKISGMGPGCPIFAVTDNKKTFNQLSLVWNVTPIYVDGDNTIAEVIEKGVKILKDNTILEEGDTIYITGGKNFLSLASESRRIGGIAIM